MSHPQGILQSQHQTTDQMKGNTVNNDPFGITDLSDFLASEGQPERFVDATTEFTINNEDEALWAMRRLAQAQRRIDQVKAMAQIELDRINGWVESNTSSHGREVAFFETALQEFLVRVREDSADGRKSLDFPDGTVTSRVTPSKVAVLDADAFVAWAEANGHSEWVRVKREADVATLKKVVDFDGDSVIDPLTGTVIEGLQHTAGGIAVSVKVVN